MNMLLSIDIGNSTIGFGLFTDPRENDSPVTMKVPSRPVKPAGTYKKIISEFIKRETSLSLQRAQPNPFDVILSSVVPSLDKPLIASIKDLFGIRPLTVSHRLETGLVFDLPNPEKIGSDRIANAAAGVHYMRKPVAVVDFGTATTITVVGLNSSLIGGAILPGLELMRKALYSETAKLPLIGPDKPLRALGNDTASAIASGTILGTAGATEALVKAMERETGLKLKLVLAGGHAKMMSPLISKRHILMPDLTFKGLRLIYLKNK